MKLETESARDVAMIDDYECLSCESQVQNIGALFCDKCAPTSPPAVKGQAKKAKAKQSQQYKECAHCGAKFSTKIDHKVFCTTSCKKTFESIISTVMKGVRPLVINALKEMRDARK